MDIVVVISRSVDGGEWEEYSAPIRLGPEGTIELTDQDTGPGIRFLIRARIEELTEAEA